MNKKITALTQASGAIDRSTALMPYVQGGVTKKISIEQITGRYRESGTIAAADILACGGVPFAVIPTPGAGYYIRILNSDSWLTFGSAAYAGGYSSLILKHATPNKAVFAFPHILASKISRGEMGILQDLVLPGDLMMAENEALFFTTFTGVDPTTGDSDLDYIIDYEIRPIP